MCEDIQEYLAVLGRVPWIIGGDWNLQPEDLRHHCFKGGNPVHTNGPTQKHGSNLDWYLTSKEVNLKEAIGQAVAGTDHVAVITTLGGAQSQTLGYRMVAPAGFDQGRLNTLAKDRSNA